VIGSEKRYRKSEYEPRNHPPLIENLIAAHDKSLSPHGSTGVLV
jgi:hypothetical protein